MNQQGPEKNSTIKRYALLIFAMITLLGVSGCMKQPTENENKANEKAMLTYLNNKYERQFTIVEYIPAERGFNDFENKNVLVAKSEDGILVNVKEKIGDKGNYYDDFINSYASKLMENKIDYSGIKNLHEAKTYVSLDEEKISLKDLQNGKFSLSDERISRRYCVISISDKSDEEVMKELYGVYKQMYTFGEERNTLVVAFGGDKSNSEKYVNNFLLYFTQPWENYDHSVKEILSISQSGLSFEQFKERLKVVGG